MDEIYQRQQERKRNEVRGMGRGTKLAMQSWRHAAHVNAPMLSTSSTS